MENMDTVRLLRECDAGVKMGVESIDEILDKVCDSDLKKLLTESREHHEKLENEIDLLLKQCNAEEKEPGTIAKGMSWMKTNMKMGMDHSDATAADLITDGANMGIKSLNRYMNKYKEADEKAKKLCDKLIQIEEELRRDLRKYL
ncbi:MAG: hypothetical protein U0L05_00500 [Schaedlerella sp.]|nr:hypothetical protein [Schaedlerella sp.]